MPKHCKELLSPTIVAGNVFKSKLCAMPSLPMYSTGGEKHPSEEVIRHYAEKAQGGAALITCSGLAKPGPKATIQKHYGEYTLDAPESNMLSQMVEAIHFHKSYATIQTMHFFERGYDVSEGVPSPLFRGTDLKRTYGKELSIEALQQSTKDLVERCKVLQELGFDGVYLHMAYKLNILARMMSPSTNKRTDCYGGSFENRTLLLRETLEGIKAACGKGFIIEACMTAEERDQATGQLIEGGWSLEDTCRLAKDMGGLLDIMHVRGWDMDEQQGLGLTETRTPYLYLAEAIKATNPEVKILAGSGFIDMNAMEEVLASGKADLIGMARGLICNPNFGQLAAEGRQEDVVPCIRCNKCLRDDSDTPYLSRCSVNPTFGITRRVADWTVTPSRKKKVAVLGGGPAGMFAAKEACDRGHDVVIFEKTDRLGGQLNIAEQLSFKWPLKDFKDYLIRQVEKRPIEVRYNTVATPEGIDDEGFDAVIAAMGSVPRNLPDDTHGAEVLNAFDAIYHPEQVGDVVTIIGGGETSLDVALFLARSGRKVTVLARDEQLLANAAPLHYRFLVLEALEFNDNITLECGAWVSEIGPDRVVYTVGDEERSVETGTLIAAIGSIERREEALAFGKCDADFFLIGDNSKVGCVKNLTRDAYAAAAQI